jgi:hypothetical protein
MDFARPDYRRSETTPKSDQRESNDEFQPAGARARSLGSNSSVNSDRAQPAALTAAFGWPH